MSNATILSFPTGEVIHETVTASALYAKQSMFGPNAYVAYQETGETFSTGYLEALECIIKAVIRQLANQDLLEADFNHVVERTVSLQATKVQNVSQHFIISPLSALLKATAKQSQGALIELQSNE